MMVIMPAFLLKKNNKIKEEHSAETIFSVSRN